MKGRHVRLLIVGLALLVALLVPMVVMASPLGQPEITHPLEGRENCTSCHAVGGAGVGAAGGTGMPDGHEGFSNSSCTSCHTVAAAAEETEEATAEATEEATAEETEEATAEETEEATAEATAAAELPASGSPFPMALTAIIAGAALVSGLGVRFLKR